MDSNLTLRSNIYINRTGRNNDRDFLQHIIDYRVLRERRDNAAIYTYGDTSWLTPLQREILSQGQPACSLERGTMSWGVPIGGNRMVCRCEQRDCPLYFRCSLYGNFEQIRRSDVSPAPSRKVQKTDALPLYNPPAQARKPRVSRPNPVPHPSSGAPAQDRGAQASRGTEPATRAAEKQGRIPPSPVTPAAQPHSTPIQELGRVAKTQNPIGTVLNAKQAVAGSTSGTLSPARGMPPLPPLNRPQPVEPITPPSRRQEPSPQKLPQKTASAGPAAEGIRMAGQEEIIRADTNARVWVNAGPGCGKTFVVIRRLKKLLEEMPDPESEKVVLVLCYSRNAVHVIRERLVEALGEQVKGWEAEGALQIRTFDSYASYMLYDELNTAWDYDTRIEKFIEMLARNRGLLDEQVDYLVVDEIQDIVGVRARMLLAMLDELSCGVMLLGDRAQAIFDWQVRDTQDMCFDTLAQELLRRNFQRFEMSGNRRQTPELSEASSTLRTQMLEGDEKQQEAAIDQFKSWVDAHWRKLKAKTLASQLRDGGDLVLCRTNGGAAYMSSLLFKAEDPIMHVLQQSSQHATLAPWIARVLEGNDGSTLPKDAFLKNAAGCGLVDAEELWGVLKSLDGFPHAPTLHIPELLRSLRNPDALPARCLSRNEEYAVVSTIHRAKGSEAKRVFWFDEPLVYDNHAEQEGALEDGLRAAYVAATRAREEIHLVDWGKSSPYMLSVGNNRWIRTGMARHGRKKYCSGIAPVPEDVDTASFASGEDALSRQAEIARLQWGTPLELWLDSSSKRYEILSDQKRIGFTSPSFTEALYAGMSATNGSRNLPIRIDEVFISSIVTVIANGDVHVAPRYAKAGCWLGIELGGFPRTHWE